MTVGKFISLVIDSSLVASLGLFNLLMVLALYCMLFKNPGVVLSFFFVILSGVSGAETMPSKSALL